MKVVVFAFVLCALCAAPSAFAARLWTSGFELNSCTAGVEVTSCVWDGSTTTSLTSSVARTGTYSMTANATGGFNLAGTTFSSGVGVAFVRAYIRITGYPSGNTSFLCLANSTPNNYGCLYMTNTGTVGINYGNTPTYGSTVTAPISLNTWYRFELKVDASVLNTQVVTGRIDGTQIDSQTGNRSFGANTITSASWGEGSWESVTGQMWFDDIAVNDTSGSAQTSYPGVGNVVYLRPNAQGDTDPDGCNNTSPCGTPANSYQNIDEVTPNDATDFIDIDTAINADWNMEDSTVGLIDSFDTVSLVDVGYRAREEAAATTVMTPRIKSVSGGTASTLSAVDLGDITWRTNQSGTTAFTNRLVSYTDPTTGVAWTPTGTNSIDSMQVGVGMTSGTVDFDVSALWAMVEYIDGTQSVNKMRIRFNGGRIKVNGGRIKLQSN